jgi:predicted RNase H-like HicB family nuclease
MVMQVSVLVEPVKGNGYRARGAEPFALVAEGATREEALSRLKEQLEARLRAGAEVVTLELGAQSHPWMEFAGMFKDDPDFKEVLDIMAENRRRIDEDPSIP